MHVATTTKKMMMTTTTTSKYENEDQRWFIPYGLLRARDQWHLSNLQFNSSAATRTNSLRDQRVKMPRNACAHDATQNATRTRLLRGHLARGPDRPESKQRRETLGARESTSQKQTYRCNGCVTPRRVPMSTSTYAALPRLSAPCTVHHLHLLLLLLVFAAAAAQGVPSAFTRDAMPPDARSPRRGAAKNDHQVSRLPLCHTYGLRARGYRALAHSLATSRHLFTPSPPLPFSLAYACLPARLPSPFIFPRQLNTAAAVPLSQQWHYRDTRSLLHDDTGHGVRRGSPQRPIEYTLVNEKLDLVRPDTLFQPRLFQLCVSPRRIRRSAFREGVPPTTCSIRAAARTPLRAVNKQAPQRGLVYKQNARPLRSKCPRRIRAVTSPRVPTGVFLRIVLRVHISLRELRDSWIIFAAINVHKERNIYKTLANIYILTCILYARLYQWREILILTIRFFKRYFG